MFYASGREKIEIKESHSYQWPITLKLEKYLNKNCVNYSTIMCLISKTIKNGTHTLKVENIDISCSYQPLIVKYTERSNKKYNTIKKPRQIRNL